MKTDFTKLPLGTRVWSFKRNESGVVSLNNFNNTYPINVSFDSGKDVIYTADGRYTETDKNPDLFLQKFEIPKEAFEMPLPELPVDSKILVSEDPKTIDNKRYFSHWENGMPACFNHGYTSWSSNGNTQKWTYWKLPEKE